MKKNSSEILRDLEIRVARLERQANEVLKRGDFVMLINRKEGQTGTYNDPARIYAVDYKFNQAQITLGANTIIVPLDILVKATGDVVKDSQIWRESSKLHKYK